ncbi:protein ImuA [uncultured Sphingomonas sp.]|uniref:ImuA family protein n=1 Tax=uncultured Sphingomonas sp. TaxID=158754 RepID=UPI0025DF0B18|nr:protein ImuA [uncultured Sphingomonas sp.]
MSAAASHSETLSRLRERVADVRPRQAPALPFGIPAIDDRLADHGLDGGALHEVAPTAPSLSDEAAATLFLAGLAARLAAAADTRVLWVVSRFDLYAPGLEQAGLPPHRLIFAEGREDKDVLALMEDGLRHGALAAVIGEVRRADMTASRRLQLAADAGGTPAFLSRRWRREGACPLSELSAATTRWRIACAPSGRLPAPGVGCARWTVELVRQRNGNPFSLLVEACDNTGRLALPAGAQHRAAPAAGATARAA